MIYSAKDFGASCRTTAMLAALLSSGLAACGDGNSGATVKGPAVNNKGLWIANGTNVLSVRNCLTDEGRPLGTSPQGRPRRDQTVWGAVVELQDRALDYLVLAQAREGVRHDLAGGVITYNTRDVQNVAIVSGFVGIYNTVAPDIGGGNIAVTVFRLRRK